MNLTIRAAKNSFFDRQKVIDAVSKAERQRLSAAGAKVRKAAQKSIRMGDRPSAPGRPPHGHKSGVRKRTSKSTGKVRFRAVSLLREFIFFSYDRAAKSVVIGPALLNGTVTRQALHALEYGGPSVVMERDGKRRTVAIRPRPFMRPALAAEMAALPELFRNSVR